MLWHTEAMNTVLEREVIRKEILGLRPEALTPVKVDIWDEDSPEGTTIVVSVAARTHTPDENWDLESFKMLNRESRRIVTSHVDIDQPVRVVVVDDAAVPEAADGYDSDVPEEWQT